jgi:very-short-patch-repair endonuclease
VPEFFGGCGQVGIGGLLGLFDLEVKWRPRISFTIGDVTRDRHPDPGDINGPFAGSRAIGEGILTRKRLRSQEFVRVFHNAYVPARLEMTHELRCRAAAVIAPGEAVLTGCSAATVRGVELAGPTDPVELLLPEGVSFTAQRGMNIRHTRRAGLTSDPWHGIGLATPMRMSLDLLTNTRLHRSFPRIIGYLDAILRAGLVDRNALAGWLASRQDNGTVRARKAVELADDRAESIQESEVRIWLVLGGLRPRVRLEVCGGRYRLDLAFPECKLAVEYDGDWHLLGNQPEPALRRRTELEADGWEFVIVTKDWLHEDPRGMVNTVREALSRRSALTGARQ